MYVQFYNFAKDNNSTARPTGTGAQFDCQLKNNTSIIRPSILLTPLANAGDITTYNYCYIPKFNRYYFIIDWAWIGGAWDISLSVDVMASFKTDIGNLSCYVERAASEYDNGLVDNFYPEKATRTYRTVDLYTNSPFYQKDLGDGCYVLGFINNINNNGQIGCSTYYAFTQTQMYQLMHFMFVNMLEGDYKPGEISLDLYKSIFNPLQYITSCIWFPKSATQFAGNNTPRSVTFGPWTTTVEAYLVPEPNVLWFTKNYYVPKHPDTASRGQFMNLTPYTKMMLYYPPFGSMPLDPSFLMDVGEYIHVLITVDQMTGFATLRVYSATSESDISQTGLLLEANGQVGVTIPLAQMAQQYSGGIVNSAISFVGGIASSVAKAVKTAAKSVGEKIGLPINLGSGSGVERGAINSCPTVTTSGTQGALLYTYLRPLLQIEYLHFPEQNVALFGRPLMKTKKLNTLAGFIKCSSAEVTIGCTEQERRMIEQYLVDGFFWE